MKEIRHTYTLDAEWMHNQLEQLGEGAEIIDDKIVTMPELAEGGLFFTQVAPGFSVVLLDLVFNQQVSVRRLKSDNGLYIIHYDFSDEVNLIYVDGVKHQIGYKANLGLGVIDHAIENVFRPVIGERIFALRLLVTKELLKKSITDQKIFDATKRKIKSDKKTLYFYDHIDSRSKVIIHGIKNKSFLDPAFEIYLQGVSLRLLSKFINRYSNLAPMLHHIPDKEVEALNLTMQFLLNNLFTSFPGVDFLAEMAGMSVTKYKSLFKKMFVATPSYFFTRQKMILANELLKSENFDQISDISRKLNYPKVNKFSLIYYQQFGRKPVEDFLKASY
ncbi:helix-turn-helix transcriptional regulator [Flavobacterium branchiicola]|uniref:AraC family transcriptional regulator n=1 Tax=Flavobacterium branchiicola TaxID=1114875 RepID=A0ABV9PDB9_9FLAO|nr:AraC family transcriptional regulator [Flavobacterium branchiicola]MBS7253606.1 helix-turn-helix transcriptional regulator [Flavobacterium branchiicola]